MPQDNTNYSHLIESNENNKYSLMLPCSPQNFGAFISSLLGKPQEITKRFFGEYDLDKNHVTNIYHLITQRVSQQNQYTAISFTADIHYTDTSSVSINSFPDFIGYNEVHPKISNGITLAWVYLIKFINKDVPEKQEIYVSIAPDGISFKISHTERTWGMDIEALLSGHIKTLINPPGGFRGLVIRHQKRMPFLAFISTIGSSIFGIIKTMEDVSQESSRNLQKIIDLKLPLQEKSYEIIEFVAKINSSGVWQKISTTAISSLIFAIIISIALMAFMDDKKYFKLRKFIVLNDHTVNARNTILAKEKTSILLMAATILGSISVGVLSNIIYTKYFSTL